MDLHSFLCNGRRILLPLDVMPIGHTYSLGFTQMHAPTAGRRRVGAYVLYVGPDTTTPLSQLGIHDNLVTFGGFTADTARLALVDGQPPSNFTRPILPWVQAVPMHTPALGFGTFPAAPNDYSSLLLLITFLCYNFYLHRFNTSSFYTSHRSAYSYASV